MSDDNKGFFDLLNKILVDDKKEFDKRLRSVETLVAVLVAGGLMLVSILGYVAKVVFDLAVKTPLGK